MNFLTNILMNFDFSIDFSLTYYLLTVASFRIGVPSTLLNDKIHNYVKKTTWLWIWSFKNWKVNTLPSKNIQLSQFVYFPLVLREREEKNNQIFRTQATGTWHWSTFVLGIRRSPRSLVRNPPCHLRRLRVWHKIWNWSRLRLCFPR